MFKLYNDGPGRYEILGLRRDGTVHMLCMTQNDDMHKNSRRDGISITQFQTFNIVRIICIYFSYRFCGTWERHGNIKMYGSHVNGTARSYFQPEHGVDQLTKCEFPTTPNPTAHLADMEGLAWLAFVETERGAK